MLNFKAKDNESCEILTLFKEIYNLNEETKNVVKKLNRLIPKNEKKQVILDQNLLQSIDEFIKYMNKLAKLLHIICTEALSMITLFGSDNSKEDAGLAPKKLEDLAYQACDKVFINDDSGPYESIR